MIELNGIRINITIFPDNTSQVWKINDHIFSRSAQSVRWYFESESEFIHLAQLKDILEKNGLESALYIDYLPYGRQDKYINNDATFALRTFSRLLNSLNFKHIDILDPHSRVALDIINNSHASYPLSALRHALENTSADLYCFPDHGALTKYLEIYTDLPFIYAEKTRDQSTGEITKYELIGDCKGKKVLMVDDICDGGATFVALSNLLRASGAKETFLFVTHGLFSKGIDVLTKAGISAIFTKQGKVNYDNGNSL